LFCLIAQNKFMKHKVRYIFALLVQKYSSTCIMPTREQLLSTTD